MSELEFGTGISSPLCHYRQINYRSTAAYDRGPKPHQRRVAEEEAEKNVYQMQPMTDLEELLLVKMEMRTKEALCEK